MKRHDTHSQHRRLHPSLLGVLAVFAVFVLLPVGARAQGGPHGGGFEERHGRVVREVDRTQELWDEVNGRVGQTSAASLRDLVEQAARIQAQAKRALEMAEGMALQDREQAEERLRASLSLTLRARDMTTRAARQLREELSLEENARRTLDRVRQQYDRLRQDEATTRSPLWDQAGQLFEQARLQWRDGNFEQALRLAQNASNVLQTLEERSGVDVDPDRVRAELRRTEQQWERWRERAGDRDAPRLDQAKRLLDEAERLLAEGRPELAAERVAAARRLLSAADAGNGAPNETDRIERALARLDAQIERFEERIDDRVPEQVQRLFRQAVEERDRARRELAAGDEARARQHVRAAADLLARVQKRLGGGRG